MNTKIKQDDRLLGRLKARLLVKLKSGLRDERGATAVFFAFGLLLLAPATLGLVDVYLSSTQRAQLQDALDTATLYAARSDKTTSADLKIIGDAALKANLKLPEGQTLVASNFVLDGIKLVGTASVTAPSVGPQLWTKADLAAESEVLRNSNNVEVALVLDTTGSMNASMIDLRAAAKDLVGLVVKDQQPPLVPYYTKVALVPYSVGVNMGAYADKARGALRQPTAISGVTKASPAVVTSVNHGLVNGEKVFIDKVGGMEASKNTSALNGKEFTVSGVTRDSFELSGVDSSKYTAYSSGGTAYCIAAGCQLYSFTNVSGSTKRFWGRPCATERIGTEAYTDVAPTTALVGRHYAGGESTTPASNTGCNSGEIVPLTSTKKTLIDKITSLNSDGSTAGQIGLAWGWYMVSPKWNGVWPDGSVPAAYTQPQTLKVVILMTDGAFNTAYCNGVNSKSSGFGQNSDRINCDATNGDPFAQARSLCTNMKAQGIILYTVGFDVGAEVGVADLMRNCASSPANVYLPGTGADLKIAFRTIAQDINSLRISK
ncbi:MAG: pilus assembly protein TadG-related protein [Pseudomonadota bacterium]|uniref:TadE/TadG family type IV pilus assembly protein n=1 Tax=unclassified Phenylobacterium TaxID=2640670 RepID=UPI0006FAC3A3|nr:MULTISPECIES: TadE/TadG family type IV pilus assembly protein [unclassified Phenylobacterium]KRB52340.1 hypothetical protein ASE02_12585 [Phenylobacterium sp. Root700]